MKTHNNQWNIEDALIMYKENVSPSVDHLQAILSQIPEQQNLKEGRAVRSPYTWLAITQVISVAAILLAFVPTYTSTYNDGQTMNPYYETDKAVEVFEQQIDTEDYLNSLKDYTL